MKIAAADYGWDSLEVSVFRSSNARFTHYRPDPSNAATLAYSVSAIYQNRSGTLWFGMLSGVVSRFDEETKTFVSYTRDLHAPRKLQGGSIGAVHEDRTGTLWLASGVGLCRYNRDNETFTRYTENPGLPTN